MELRAKNNDVKNAVNRTNSPKAEPRRLEKYDRNVAKNGYTFIWLPIP